MSHLRDLFSRKNLPKFFFVLAIYLLGRMEGEGRFRWSDIFSTAWNTIAKVGTEAAGSARDAVGI